MVFLQWGEGTIRWHSSICVYFLFIVFPSFQNCPISSSLTISLQSQAVSGWPAGMEWERVVQYISQQPDCSKAREGNWLTQTFNCSGRTSIFMSREKRHPTIRLHTSFKNRKNGCRKWKPIQSEQQILGDWSCTRHQKAPSGKELQSARELPASDAFQTNQVKNKMINHGASQLYKKKKKKVYIF